MSSHHPSRLRCLLVWVTASVAAALIGRLLVGDLLRAAVGVSGPSVGVEAALIALCEVLLLGCLVWAWAAATAVVGPLVLRQAANCPPCDGEPGAGRSWVPQGWQRMVLVVCGAALSAGVALPAHAARTDAGAGHETTPVLTVPGSLDGLPLPRLPVSALDAPALDTRPAPQPTTRAAGSAASVAPRAVAVREVVVREVVIRAGDTLWAIAAADLGPGVDDAAIAGHCHTLHRLNAETVGPDPDLVFPGQRLTLP